MGFDTFVAAIELDVFSALRGVRSVTIDELAAEFSTVLIRDARWRCGYTAARDVFLSPRYRRPGFVSPISP